MKFQLPESFSSILRTAAKLDPTAQPFVPETPHCETDSRRVSETNPNFVIYNDGVPSLTPQNLKDILAGIDDEAIDENFAPDAQEAAELEVVDQFLNELADIDMLEDREVRPGHIFDVISFSQHIPYLESRSEHGMDFTTSANAGKVVVLMVFLQPKPLEKPSTLSFLPATTAIRRLAA
jgi:hypothetical protein